VSDSPRDEESRGSLPSDAPPLPDLDFSTFVMSIIGSAMVHFGDAPDPDKGGAVAPNLLMAKQDIALLALLQDKTKGNLSGEEERVLSQGLYDLRMRFVEVSKE